MMMDGCCALETIAEIWEKLMVCARELPVPQAAVVVVVEAHTSSSVNPKSRFGLLPQA
jgi:hypothetical protein